MPRGRKPVFADNAARQAAYRERKAAAQALEMQTAPEYLRKLLSSNASSIDKQRVEELRHGLGLTRKSQVLRFALDVLEAMHLALEADPAELAEMKQMCEEAKQKFASETVAGARQRRRLRGVAGPGDASEAK